MERDRPITDLLGAWAEGDREALGALMEVVYTELQASARRAMAGERENHTLQPTALVNEVYLRLERMKRVSWENRTPFFAFAARLMRRILVEHARAVGADKRGGKLVHVTLESANLPAPTPTIDSLALEDALTKIEAVDQRLGQIIELRFYAGLNETETASVLGVSRSSVQREWATGKRLLAELLKDRT